MVDDGVDAAWGRIEPWLAEHAPVTAASLNPPVDPGRLADLKGAVGPLPADLESSWLRHDGVDPHAAGAFALDSWFPTTARRALEAGRGFLELAATFPDEEVPFWTSTRLVVAEPSWGGALYVDLAAFGDGVFAWDPEAYVEPRRVAGSWSQLLAATADRLEGRSTEATVPDVRSGRLVWIEPDPSVPRARPVTAEVPPVPDSVADQAPPDRVGGHRAIGRGPDWIVERDLLLLTFAAGVGAGEVLRRCGADPQAAVEGDDRWARGLQATAGHRPVVRATDLDGWAVAVSREAPSGVLVERVRALSVGTRAVGFGVDHLAATAVIAERGEVLLTVRTGPWGTETSGEVDRYEHHLRDLDLLPSRPGTAVDDLEVAALDLVLRLGPRTFGPTVLDGPLLGAPILPLLPDPSPVPPPAVDVAFDPDLAVRLEFATAAVQRRLVAELLHGHARDLDLAEDPVLMTEVDRAAGLSAPLPPLLQDTPVALALRAIAAERAATASRWAAVRDDQEQVVAWNAVAHWGDVLHRLLVRPPGEALAVASPWYDHDEPRRRLLRSLASVVVPPDAVAVLTARREARFRAGEAWPDPSFRRPAR